jgi:hypothetical protein
MTRKPTRKYFLGVVAAPVAIPTPLVAGRFEIRVTGSANKRG